MKLYALLDKKMGQHGVVMMGANDGHMCRTLRENIPGSKSTVELYPEDFDLYQVGEFDGDSGNVSGEYRFVCNLAVIFHPQGEVK